MPSSSDRLRAERPLWKASRSLPVVGMALVVLFATNVAGAVLPFQPIDPAWQLRFAIGLLSSSPLALLALALLHVAFDLDSQTPWIEKRLRLWSQLAIAVTLGFLLLVPLMARAAIQLQATAHERQMEDVKGKERKVASLRLALQNSGSVAQLNQQLQQLQGPQLGPADLTLPLPELKQRLGQVFEESDRLIARQRSTVPPRINWATLPDLISKCLSSLALALGFSALATRPGYQISLLQEFQDSWTRRNLRKTSRRSTSSQEEYIRQLSRDN
jgi:hypothetical protein